MSEFFLKRRQVFFFFAFVTITNWIQSIEKILQFKILPLFNLLHCKKNIFSKHKNLDMTDCRSVGPTKSHLTNGLILIRPFHQLYYLCNYNCFFLGCCDAKYLLKLRTFSQEKYQTISRERAHFGHNTILCGCR